MQSVRIQLTVDSEMSLEFARLDMSKPSDSHGQLSGERNCAEPRCPEPTCRALARKKEAGRVRWYRAPGGARQCDEVKAMAASGTITRASLL